MQQYIPLCQNRMKNPPNACLRYNALAYFSIFSPDSLCFPHIFHVYFYYHIPMFAQNLAHLSPINQTLSLLAYKLFNISNI